MSRSRTGFCRRASCLRTLLIYYGYPSLINQAKSLSAAASQFARYNDVILGDGLEATTHPDHSNTVAILANPAMAHTVVYGYIDLGVTTQDLSIAQIEARVDEWKATGAKGIFFDDFGYDFDTTRARQNAAVNYAHSKGLTVAVNAFVPADAFGTAIDPQHNPTGAPSRLYSSDAYLYESYQVVQGNFDSEGNWQTKVSALNGYRAKIGFHVFTVTTNSQADAYNQNRFFYSWYSALLYGYTAVGWGEYLFSADDNITPFRARPSINPGTSFTGPVTKHTDVFTRQTNLGQVLVNASTHAFGFTPAGATMSEGHQSAEPLHRSTL